MVAWGEAPNAKRCCAFGFARFELTVLDLLN